MGRVLEFNPGPVPSAWSAPTVLTGKLLDRIAASNAVARNLRRLGYRIVDEDVSPNDDGSPILQVDMRGMSARSLMHLSSCAVRNTETGIERVTIDGVRVFWLRSE